MENRKGIIQILKRVVRHLGMSESTILMREKIGKDVYYDKYICAKPVLRDDGEFYNSIAEAARFNFTHPIKISEVCRGVRVRTSGHSFSFLTREEEETLIENGVLKRSLFSCPQCTNCRFKDNAPYCKSINGEWVKLPQAIIDQAEYCPRFKKKGAAGNEKS